MRHFKDVSWLADFVCFKRLCAQSAFHNFDVFPSPFITPTAEAMAAGISLRFKVRGTFFLSAGDRLSCLQKVDGESFEYQSEATAPLSPRNLRLFHAVLRTVHPQNRRVKKRFELTAVQMTPLTRRSMVVTRQ